MLHTEEFACPRDSSLNLIGDEEDVVLCAQITDLWEIVVIGNNNSRLAV
jgi:hypothetical protein